MYRVEVQDQETGNGAYHTGTELGVAVLSAVSGSRTYTLQAFLVGVIAAAVIDEVFEDVDQDRLMAFLRGVDVPKNVQPLPRLDDPAFVVFVHIWENSWIVNAIFVGTYKGFYARPNEVW